MSSPDSNDEDQQLSKSELGKLLLSNQPSSAPSAPAPAPVTDIDPPNSPPVETLLHLGSADHADTNCIRDVPPSGDISFDYELPDSNAHSGNLNSADSRQPSVSFALNLISPLVHQDKLFVDALAKALSDHLQDQLSSMLKEQFTVTLNEIKAVAKQFHDSYADFHRKHQNTMTSSSDSSESSRPSLVSDLNESDLEIQCQSEPQNERKGTCSWTLDRSQQQQTSHFKPRSQSLGAIPPLQLGAHKKQVKTRKRRVLLGTPSETVSMMSPAAMQGKPVTTGRNSAQGKKIGLRSLEAQLTEQLFEKNSLCHSTSFSSKLHQVVPQDTRPTPSGSGFLSAFRRTPREADHSPVAHRISLATAPSYRQVDEAKHPLAVEITPLGKEPIESKSESKIMPSASINDDIVQHVSSVDASEQGRGSQQSKQDGGKGRKIEHLRRRREKDVTANLSLKVSNGMSALDGSNEELVEPEVNTFGCVRNLVTIVGNISVNAFVFVSGLKPISQYTCVSLLFQACTMLVALGSFISSMRDAVLFKVMGEPLNTTLAEPFHEPLLLYDTALALGAVLGLFATGCLRLNLGMSRYQDIFERFAAQKGFPEDWQEDSRWDAVTVLALWSIAVAERIRCIIMRGDGNFDVVNCLSLACFVASSFILVAILFSVMQLCLGLRASVDNFSFQVYNESDFGAAVRNWTVLQALIRLACSAVQPVFLLLQATIVLVIMTAATDFYKYGADYSMMFSGGLVLLNLSRVFFHAASVTDHCERVPAFINSLNFGKDLDQDRMYIVWYIKLSQAGFYVFEVQLTSSLVLKSFYILAAVVLAVVTKVMSGI